MDYKSILIHAYFLQASTKVAVKVVARCRPFTDTEKGKGAARIVKMTGDKTTLQNPQQGGTGKVRYQIFL